MNDLQRFLGEIIDEGPEEGYEKTFTAHAEFKAVDSDERLIEGMASTELEDRYDEIIAPRAFRSTLSDFKKHGKILINHGGGFIAASAEERMPIGRPVDAKVTEDGLWIKARIGKGDLIESVWSRIEQGLLDAFSIGFMTRRGKWIDVSDDNEETGKRRVWMITDLELLETSVVTIPANRGSFFSVTKGLNLGNDWAQLAGTLASLAGDDTPHLVSGRKPENAVLETLREVNQQIRERMTVSEIRNVTRGIQKQAETKKV